MSAIEMKWSDVNLDTGVLHIPKPKGGEARAFDLPLPTLLVDLFRARWVQHEKLFAEDNKTAPWVFATPDSTSGHIVEVRAARLGVSPHDMRRLFIACAESCDVSPYALKLLTNHALPRGDVTAGYTSVDTERLRPVMETIAGRLTALCQPGFCGKASTEPA